MMNHKPTKIIVPITAAQSWRAAEFRLEEKVDGRFDVRAIDGLTVAGEAMGDGRFVGFDCLAVDGQSIADQPLRARLGQLLRLPQLLRPVTGHGVEFIEAVLACGGEGVVAKRWEAPYDAAMFAIKRIIEVRCVVTEILPFQAVKIADAQSGADRGKVKIAAFKLSKIRVGSIIKVVGMNLTETGMIREPRLCTDSPDSWLVSI